MEKTLSKEWFEAFNRRDWDSLESFYAKDVLFHSKSGDVIGSGQIINVSKKWTVLFPDLQIHPVYTHMEAHNVIVVHWRAQSPTHQLVFHGLTCFRYKNGKVIEHWASVDYRPISQFEKAVTCERN